MTEIRGYLQEAPREGAADLVARASVIISSLPLTKCLCVYLYSFLAKLHSPEQWKKPCLNRRDRTKRKGKSERKKND